MNSVYSLRIFILNDLQRHSSIKILAQQTLILLYALGLIVFSPIVGLCENVSIRLYDEIQGHNDVIYSGRFSSDGKLFASGDVRGSIIIWAIDSAGFTKYRQYNVEREEINSLAFSADGNLLFSASNNRSLFSWGNQKRIRAWDITSAGNDAIKTFLFDEPVKSIALSLDGRTLLTGGGKGKIGIFDIGTGRLIKTIENAHNDEVLYLAWTGENAFQSVGADRKKKYWDMNSSEPVLTGVDEKEYEIKAVECNASMDICAVGAFALRFKGNYREKYMLNNIYLKDGISWSRVGILKGHDLEINALAFSPQGNFLASGGKGEMIYIWNIEKGKIEADVQYGSEITMICFSPTGQWLVASGKNKKLSVYSLNAFEKAKTLPENFMMTAPDQTPGEKYAVIIGLSKYNDTNIPSLSYSVKDAKDIYEFFTSEEGGLFKKEQIRLLLNQDATKVNIEDALKNFLPVNAGRDDTVIIYFAGHGTPDTDLTNHADDGMEKYLVPYDADLDKISATCIPMSEFDQIFSSIRSRRVIFFLDSCFSGGGAGKTDTPDVLKRTFVSRTKQLRGDTMTPNFLNQLTEGPKGYGKVLITASQANEQALELDSLGHGLFTYYLLEGLKGKADDGDGFITLNKVYEYLEDRVAKESRKAGGKQTPMMVGAITGKIVLSKIDKKNSND